MSKKKYGIRYSYLKWKDKRIKVKAKRTVKHKNIDPRKIPPND